MPKEVEVYALALKLDNSIQVLVGVTDFYNKEMNPYELPLSLIKYW